MSELIPRPYRGAPSDPEPTTLYQPGPEIERRHRRWEIQAARWRAVALAEVVFGDGVRSHLASYGPRGAFRGLLHLEVPFSSLDRHWSLESRFVAAAGEDPVLSAHPFIFVFAALATDGA